MIDPDDRALDLSPVPIPEGQLSVFDAPFVRGSDTSREAAAVLDASDRRSRQEAAIFDLVDAAPDGLACFEVEELTGGAHESVSRALTTMTKPQYGREILIDSGRRRVRPSTGRRQTVYEVNPSPPERNTR